MCIRDRGKAAGGQITFLPVAPLMHGATQWGVMGQSFTGNKVVLVARFDPHEVWALVEAERVNMVMITGDAMGKPLVEVLEHGAGAVGDGAEGVVGKDDGQAGGFAKEAVEVADEGAAAGEDDAAIHQVGGELGGAAFEGGANDFDDGVKGAAKAFANFLGRCV